MGFHGDYDDSDTLQQLIHDVLNFDFWLRESALDEIRAFAALSSFLLFLPYEA